MANPTIVSVTPDEAEAAAAQVAEENGAPAPMTPPDPMTNGSDGIPDKFQNPDGTLNQDALLASYKHLEQAQSGAPAQEPVTPPVTPATGTEGEPATPAPMTIDQAQEAAQGLWTDEQQTAWHAEVIADGKLSDEARTAIKAKGFNDAQLDMVEAGIVAKATAARQAVFDSVGGEEQFGNILAWASNPANVQPAEAQAFNDAMGSGDQARINMAVAGLNARFQQSNGKLVQGTAGNPSAVQPFQSDQQMMAAMDDPRYIRGDKDYHAWVDARIAAGGA